MPLFRRPASPPDEYLTMLSARDADHLRSLVRTALAERGTEGIIGASAVTRADGGGFGLWNLAAQCASIDRRHWPSVVREHVRRVDEGMSAPPVESLAASYVRLWPDGDDLTKNPHVAFAPGLVQVLALDAPETVRVMTTEMVERLGGWATVYDAGLRNLRGLRLAEPRVVDVPGSSIHLLEDESVYTAGLAIVLGDRLPPDAVWVLAVPTRHILMWHVIRDSSAVPAISALARYARGLYDDAAYRLSPHVYWSDGTSYRQLTQPGSDGGIAIVPDDDFTAILTRVLSQSRQKGPGEPPV